MAEASADYLAPEARARMEIDEQLGACGWVVQDYKHAAVAAAQGVAVREVPTEAGPADYVLFVDRQAVGVIEAKKAGSTLTGVEPQTRKYRAAYPEELPAFTVDGALPFGYESTGAETRFTCGLDPVPASRRVFTFHRPETLAHWVGTYTDRTQLGGFVAYPTLRLGIRDLPELEPDPPHLWPAQAEAIRNLEESLRANRPRALIQMATGAGKTFTAANACYRLVRHADAARVLFLVDRANLGRQALREFQGFAAPDDPRKFSELYNVRHLTDSRVDMAAETSAKVHICTIQRLFSILRGDDPEGFDDALDERSGFEVEPTQPVEVAYNPKVPIESYDLIIVDECHRSIYGVWRQVLEYFDAFLVGLTATPGIQTFAFFNQNLVMEYGHAQAVADRVNVDFDVFRIRTEITESGGTVPAEFVTGFRDRDTRQLRLEKVDEDIDYSAAELDRRVVAPDQIRTVVRTLRDSLPEDFQGPGAPWRRPAGQRPQDADLRQGRQPRRRHRADRAGGVRPQQRGRGEDHLPLRRLRQQARGSAPAVPHQLPHPHRGDRGHDRHRHRREAHRVRGVHAHGAQPQLLRADEGPGRAGDRRRGSAQGHARRQGQGPLRDRGRGGRDRGRPARHRAAGAPARGELRPAAEPCRPGFGGPGRGVVGGVAPGPPRTAA